MSVLVNDLRYGVRLLMKSWAFTLVTVTALAIGIGANITIFGFVNAILLRPLDVPDPDRLVRADAGRSSLMPLLLHSDYEAYRDRNQSFETLAIFHHGWMTPMRIEDSTEMIAVTPVSGNYFETLGVTASRGRTITPEDDEPDAPSVVVLSHEGLNRFFGGDQNVVGRTIFINRQPFLVVGITPPNFKGTVYPNLPQVYSTFRPTRAIKADPPGYLMGRLKQGVSLSEAKADLTRVAAQLATEQGTPKTIAVYRATASYPQIVHMLARLGTLLMVIMAAVLWIACSNIAVLLLARAAARRREIGIRLAMGASAAHLIRQLFIENLLLAATGGLAAAFVAHATSRWLTQIYLPVPMPIALIYELDWRVITFATAVSLAATLMFSLGPVLHSLKTDVAASVKQGDHATAIGTSRMSFSLVVTQVAASTAVLATAALMVRSVVTPPDHGFEADSVLTASVRLLGSTAEERVDFIDDVLTRLEGVTDIASITAVDSVPMTHNHGPLLPLDLSPDSSNRISDKQSARPLVYGSRISRGYFQTLGIPLLQGRDFTRSDNLESPEVGIVNETLARRFWQGESPIGKFLLTEDGGRIEIVGLARDIKYQSRDEEPRAFVYRPLQQEPTMSPTFLVKTAKAAETATSLVRQHVAAIDPDIVVYNIKTLEDRVKPAVHLAIAWVSGVLGLLGAFLGAIGTYGLISWSMVERRREFALRLALGASQSSIRRLTTRRGMIWAGAGISLGLAGFLAGAELLRSFLRGISPFEPFSLVGVAMLLLSVVYLACYFPARRMRRTYPFALLRE